jgi:TPR repeat protein
MDSPCKFTNLNTPIVNLMKCVLLVFISLSLVPPVFADTAQNEVNICKDKLFSADLDDALRFCTKAAEQGDVNAQYYLGLSYDDGERRDGKKSIYWYTKAADQGDYRAQRSLGYMHAYGDRTGIPKDYNQSLYWFERAAVQGDLDSQLKMAYAYSLGNIANFRSPDEKLAFYWYSKAAAQGDALAQFCLGQMYHNGEGTPKDNVLSHIWLSIAAAQVDEGGARSIAIIIEGAARSRTVVEEEMTPSQIAEAQKQTKEYYAKYVK